MFEVCRLINLVADKKETISQADKDALKENFAIVFNDILGMKGEQTDNSLNVIESLMEVILSLRSEARANKDWAKSDLIRDELSKAGITIKDGKDGASWTMD
jgi:cysteinyl-tRNA synthetase